MSGTGRSERAAAAVDRPKTVVVSDVSDPGRWSGAALLLPGVAPRVLVGLPVPVAGVLALAVAVQLLLQQSDADYRVGPATYVFALNEGHRFHHLKWAGVGDVNFGLFTLIWDHLYRTYSYDPAHRFSSGELGMAAKPHYPTAYSAQLRYPFTPDGGC